MKTSLANQSNNFLREFVIETINNIMENRVKLILKSKMVSGIEFAIYAVDL